jgi:hypothetical protein
MKKSYTKIPGQPLNKEIFNIRLHPSKLSEKRTSVRNYAQEVPEWAGTIEAENKETIVGNMNNDGMPMFQKIGGKSHAQGGTILNAPENAYVYSKFNKMKIKNPYILQSFGLDPFTAKTPAQISNKYDFSDSVRGLFDPMSDKLQQKTYEMNIRNSINKLGKLALVQEGIKGFPQGIPKISEPYLINTGMSPDLFIGNEPGDFNQQGMPMAKSGGQLSRATGKRKVKITKAPNSMYKYGGGFDMYQKKGNVDTTGLAELDRKYQEMAPKKVLQLKESTPIERYNEKLKQALLSDDLNVLTNAIRKIEKEFPGAVEFNKSLNPFARFTTDDSDIMIANTYDMLKDRLAQQKYSKGKDILVKNRLTTEKSRADYAKNNYFKYQDIFEKMSENDPRKYSMIPQLIKLQKYLPEQHGVPELGVRGDIINPAYSYTDADWNNITKHVDNLDNILNPNKPAKYNEFENFWVNPYSGVGPYNPNRQNVKQIKEPKVAPAQTPMGARSVADSIAMSQGVTPQVVTPKPDTSGLAEFKRKHGLKKLGGVALPMYNGGGNVTADDGKFRSYEDGSILDIASNKWIQDADPNWKPKKKASGTGAKSTPKSSGPSSIDPYFHADPQKALLDLFIVPEGLRKESVETSQRIDPRTGIAGKAVDVNAFKARMAPYLEEFKKKYKRDFDYSNPSDVKKLQEEYNPFVKKYVYDLAKSKGYPEDYANKLAETFVKTQGFTGKPDKNAPKDVKVRAADQAFGEFTSSRFFPDLKPYKKPEEKQVEEEPEEETEIPKGELKGTTEPRGPIGKWWWQDRVQAFADLMDRASINKYYPQNFAPDLYLAQATFFDPNSELRQQASIASTAARAARTIADPNQMSAILNNIQATAAEQAANTIGKYSNLNVGVANQFANLQSNILNQYSRALAQGKTQEASQLAILNQQYDNALRQMRARQTANYKQAITNMAKTDVLNSLYPQYAVDPETGGTRPVFLRGKVPTAANPYASKDSVTEIKEIQEKLGLDNIDDAIKIWERSKGYDTAQTNRMTNLQQYPSSYPAYGNDGYSQQEDTQEEDDGTAYNYDYWNNQYQQPSYDDTEGYDYEV